MYLVYFLNIDILALNIDILPDILDNDTLSSYWKPILYFPHFQYKESIKLSYFSRVQTEAIKTMVAGGSCCGEWVVLDGAGPQGRGPRELLEGVGWTKIVVGGGGGGGDSSERCSSRVVGSLRSLS